MKKSVKRYNLSKIMKRAWELVKKAGLCISEGLKLAWKEARHMGEITKGSVKQIAWAQDIKEGMIKALNISLKNEKESGSNYFVSIREKNLIDIEKISDAKWFINLFITAKEIYKAEICFGNYMTKEELADDYASLVSSKLMETF